MACTGPCGPYSGTRRGASLMNTKYRNGTCNQIFPKIVYAVSPFAHSWTTSVSSNLNWSTKSPTTSFRPHSCCVRPNGYCLMKIFDRLLKDFRCRPSGSSAQRPESESNGLKGKRDETERIRTAAGPRHCFQGSTSSQVCAHLWLLHYFPIEFNFK